MHKKTGLFLFILLFLAGCSKQACSVGDIRINEKDLSSRAEISEIYYPGSGKRYIALAQLVKGYISLEILKELGYMVDEAVLESEADRIDKNTKAPDILNKIKEIFGRDRKGYIKAFVQIVYAERVLYNEVFLNSESIHKEQYQKAEDVLKAALSYSKPLREVAKERGLKAERLRISSENGIKNEDFSSGKRAMPAAPVGLMQARRLLDVVSGVKHGEVYPEVIGWQESYQVIRFIKNERDEFIIDSISIPKRNYDEWFWDKASGIPVKIYDKELKDELLSEVSWANYLKIE